MEGGFLGMGCCTLGPCCILGPSCCSLGPHAAYNLQGPSCCNLGTSATVKALVLVCVCLDSLDHFCTSMHPVSPVWSCLPVIHCPVRTQSQDVKTHVEMWRMCLCNGLLSKCGDCVIATVLYRDIKTVFGHGLVSRC